MHCPDRRCVPSQTPVEPTYVSTSGPAHSGGKTPHTHTHTAVEQPASLRQPALELGGPSLMSKSSEILATAFALRHCVSL